MKHYRAYKRRKKIIGTEQYFNQNNNNERATNDNDRVC
jgi:hypothetical protein